MRRFRVSIAALLAGIALFAVSFTTLIYPSPLVANAYHTLTLGILTIGILGAIYSRGRRRAFWVGFSTCGWAYFLAVFGPEPISHVGPNLVTESILDIIYPHTIPRSVAGAALIRPPAPQAAPVSRLAMMTNWPGMISEKVILTEGLRGGGPPFVPPTPWEIWTTPDRATQSIQKSPRMFRRIGHSMFCLLFALIGGYAARRFRSRACVVAFRRSNRLQNFPRTRSTTQHPRT